MYFSRVRIRPDIYKSSQLARVLEGNVYGCHQLLWDLFPEQDKRTFLYREEIAREQLGSSPTVRGEPVYYIVSQTKPVEAEGSLFKVESKEYDPQLTVGQRLQFDCRLNPVISRQGKKHDVAMDAQLQFLTSLIKSHGLESTLPAKTDKGVYKKLLLEKGGAALETELTELLSEDRNYAERLGQISGLADKLEWAIKARVDQALENWMIKQGVRCGFELLAGDDGLPKLQNSTHAWHGLQQKTAKKGEKSGFSSVDFTGELQITDPDKFRQTLFGGLGRAKAFGCGLLMVRRPGNG
ncbi:type I-E CRISPR-associated protein Cas6/Cse3/CasE [Methylomonas methanica]|uniref:Type I-E CRISPR-associated protein Cas6/Cse3/CasE n=1 Tax=Methylomonas methanica TaxID=421 RepID=A0A177MWZ6_METMH|nr:type I-E CRISPR-associated protein Cas6/Cse3/CasE [Methylomonas methanica]OAI10238.1 type I-E CRISPR-associated protein Cas6/Cse3/CasE [Methylomonas methanica]